VRHEENGNERCCAKSRSIAPGPPPESGEEHGRKEEKPSRWLDVLPERPLNRTCYQNQAQAEEYAKKLGPGSRTARRQH
jgi:hypothetical protein